MILAQTVDATPVSWWVLTPTLVLLTLALLTVPVWPWSRGWGWAPAGMSAVAVGTVIVFTLAWLMS